MRAVLLLALLAFSPFSARAQQDGLLQLDGDLDRFLTRQHGAGLLPDAILTHRPFSAYQARVYLDTLAHHAGSLSPTDQTLLARFRGEDSGPNVGIVQQFAGFLYPNGQDFVAARGDGFALQVNPLAYVGLGRGWQNRKAGRTSSPIVWQNTRGIRGSGHISHVFFEARVEENQRRDVRYLFQPGINTAPRLGNVQKYESEALDYYRATAIVGFTSRFFEVRAGRDRNRWGPGRTGLLLSDYAAPYDHLQLRTRVWRLEYVNVFANFTNVQEKTRSGEPFARRYGAFHHLTLRLPGRVDVSAYEGIIFTDTSSSNRRHGFDPTYLNPILFYRSAEQDRNSPDNAFVGFSAGWGPAPGLRLYGDVLFDEFSARLVGEESWANKWAWTLGAQTAEWPVPGLTLRAEWTRLRPYLYSHRSAATALLHYNDGLGHPAGPNAIDWSFFADYQPTPRVSAQLNVGYTRRGRNDGALNYGSDPRLSYDTRVSSTDVRLLQGVRQTQWLAEATAGYEVLPGLYAAGAVRAEMLDDAKTGRDRYVAPYLLLRWGLPYQSLRW